MQDGIATHDRGQGKGVFDQTSVVKTELDTDQVSRDVDWPRINMTLDCEYSMMRAHTGQV